MVKNTLKKQNQDSENGINKIEILTIQQQLLLKNQIRETSDYIKTHPLVSQVWFERTYGCCILFVKFKDGITEHWNFWDLGTPLERFRHHSHIIYPDTKVHINRNIPTYREFETNPLNDNYEELLPYFLVSKQNIKKAGFCEIRLKAHELIKELTTQGWTGFKYPEIALQKDLDNVYKFDAKKCWEAMHRISFYRHLIKGFPGRVLLAHFNPIDDVKHGNRKHSIREAWIPKYLCHAIDYCIEHDLDITRAAIVRVLTTSIPDGQKIAGPKLPNITGWKAIFEHFRPKSIFDLDPNYGEKAIAAAVCKIGYEPERSSDHLDKMIKFINVRPGEHDITIINCINPLSDEEFFNRVKRIKTSKAIAVVTQEQLNKLKIVKQFEIRNNPSQLTKKMDILAYFEPQK